MENLLSFKTETSTLTSSKSTLGTFTFLKMGFLRIITFGNIEVKDDYETSFSNVPDWFCKDSFTVMFSAVNGSGGYGIDTAECAFIPSEKKIIIYPRYVGQGTNHQLSGQCISVSKAY